MCTYKVLKNFSCIRLITEQENTLNRQLNIYTPSAFVTNRKPDFDIPDSVSMTWVDGYKLKIL